MSNRFIQILTQQELAPLQDQIYRTEIERIDQDHTALFQQISQIIGLLETDSLNLAITEFMLFQKMVKRHYRYEESLMKRHAYPHFAIHRQRHLNALKAQAFFFELLTQNQIAFGQAVRLFLDIFIEHTHRDDQLLATFLQKRS